MLLDEFLEMCEDSYNDRHGIYAHAVSAAVGLHILIEEDYDVTPFFELICDEIALRSRHETLNHVKCGWIDLDGNSLPLKKVDSDG